MMKNWIVIVCFLLTGIFSYGQISVGSVLPNPHADLTLGSDNKGMLINSVALQSVDSASPLDAKTMQPGMMVYNTTVSDKITEGYYFWSSSKVWTRMYVKTVPTRDMQFVTFKQTTADKKSRIKLNYSANASSRIELTELTYTYDAVEDGKVFLDYVLYASMRSKSGESVAGNTYCFPTVTEGTTTVMSTVVALSPYVVGEGDIGSDEYDKVTFGSSNIQFDVKAGKQYKIALTAVETYSDGGRGDVYLGTFAYRTPDNKLVYCQSSLKVTFLTEPNL